MTVSHDPCTPYHPFNIAGVVMGFCQTLARLEKELKQGPLFHERAKAEMGMGQKKPTPKL